MITRIINMSLAFGHIPASMKMALVALLIEKPLLDKEVLQASLQPHVPVQGAGAGGIRETRTTNCLLEPRQSACIEQTTTLRQRC